MNAFQYDIASVSRRSLEESFKVKAENDKWQKASEVPMWSRHTKTNQNIQDPILNHPPFSTNYSPHHDDISFDFGNKLQRKTNS